MLANDSRNEVSGRPANSQTIVLANTTGNAEGGKWNLDFPERRVTTLEDMV